MADAIVGAQAGLRVLVDGSVRLTIDVEPKDRVAAMTLFGAPGQSIALAALKDGHAAKEDKPASSFRDLGPICREAIDLCKNPRFQQWAHKVHRFPVADEISARNLILVACSVESRKDLDTAEGARELFIAHVRKPFHQWLETNP